MEFQLLKKAIVTILITVLVCNLTSATLTRAAPVNDACTGESSGCYEMLSYCNETTNLSVANNALHTLRNQAGALTESMAPVCQKTQVSHCMVIILSPMYPCVLLY